ncbi:5-formyltetrahydrofolate cyclo-ligase [Actinokineospora baliensis]|uniref:5-formyltetrahydrofolate cyclo-ligase n=1 Tax=Actinokineospora baliensis TaxID=547056 RepID=UPI0027DBE556|nr:5-formyltetrahydrofolate cyclo-ligase [Actinokineospora baliensis]MBM7774309.1 5-formyltetrahydrofolate cyclo-ligase [Actinokineospora baliensis]
MSSRSAVDLKGVARREVWAALTAAGAVRDEDVFGRIPDFIGADSAAQRLADMPAWKAARVVKVVPDKAQRPVRIRALREGKTVYMAVPKLASRRPFYVLDPAVLSVSAEEAVDPEVAAEVAPTVDVDQLNEVDLVVCGSVVVNRAGVRLGKGAGYADIELALLQEAGLVRADTLITSTVHPLQVVDGSLPEGPHDFSMDVIVTADETIACSPPRRPPGILWDRLDVDKIAAIPALAARMPHVRTGDVPAE